MREEVAGTRSNNEIDVEKAVGKYRRLYRKTIMVCYNIMYI